MRPLALPAGLSLVLAAYLLDPLVRGTPGLRWSFAVASVGVLAWTAILYAKRRSRAPDARDRLADGSSAGGPDAHGRLADGSSVGGPGTGLTLELAIRRPHWIQLLAQGSVLAWWGWHVRAVYEFAPFILAQLALAVAVESLFGLTRRGRCTLGFGPVPVVFSLNLFLWFHLPWFFFQFAMVVLVYVGKEFVRRQVDGRSRHIFNPSAFALAIASLALIATGQTEITQGVEIAQSQYVPPHIFLVIFLAAFPGQLLFGVATMTMPAVLVIYGFSAAYHAATGIFFFHDAYIPIAVFLGLHLLFTDPATSPRSELGRVVFGMLYGAGVVASVFALNAVGAPPFYDKLLPVPILNVLAPQLDRLASAVAGRLRIAWAAVPGAVPARRRFLTAGTWAAVFAVLSLGGVLGDDHPGQYYPFWRDACEVGSVAAGAGDGLIGGTRAQARACDYMGFMQQNFCDRGSGWACNEFGVFLAQADRDYRGAAREFDQACARGFDPGCANLRVLLDGDDAPGDDAFVRAPPPTSEMPLVLRGSKGPVAEREFDALVALACQRGWREWECR